MLQHIHIRDLAIVSNLEIELRRGMTALTGETGAGKSILIDALGFALGDRADSSMVKQGKDRAEISAVFGIAQLPELHQWLESHGLDAGDECHLRRLINRTGNSRAFINGTPVPVKLLQELGDQLVDIHGQHAHHSLLARDHQRYLLDDYAGQLPLANEVARCYHQWRDASKLLAELTNETAQRLERLDLLQFQVRELHELSLGKNELDDLEQELKRLSNSEQLIQSCNMALGSLGDDTTGVLTQLHRCSGTLSDFASLDDQLRESCELIDNAIIQVQEANTSLQNFSDNLDLDPARLQAVDQRLSDIHSMARKLRCKPEELGTRLAELEAELEQLNGADNQVINLQQKVESCKEEYIHKAKQLSNKRAVAARELSKQITKGMQALGMPEGEFQAELTHLEEERVSQHGFEQATFKVSANKGHPPRPLSKVASGGELSRISLAIQVATLSCRQVPTLIFDEVDVGIGGGVAEIVGRMLSQLGENRQVLCVTHLPQVASQSHQHLLVEKSPQNGTTESILSELAENQRIEEIARMLGGLEITEQTLAHAKEMIERGVAYTA